MDRRAGQRAAVELVAADSVSRASFLLTAAYLTRDRDVKLRVYPGIAPMLVMPFIFLMQGHRGQYHEVQGAGSGFDGFGVAFSGAYLGLIPYLGLKLISFSQQWQAADLFRVAPLAGPMPLCDGARRAVLLFLTVPMLIVFGVLAFFLGRGSSHLPLLLPGLLAVPIYALIPCIGGKAVPLSTPTEEAKSAGRGLSMIGVMLISIVLAAMATLAWSKGIFHWFLLAEAVLAIGIYAVMRVTFAGTPWPSMED